MSVVDIAREIAAVLLGQSEPTPFRLEYFILSREDVKDAHRTASKFRAVSDTLAVAVPPDSPAILVHGNSRILIKRGVSTYASPEKLHPIRLWRNWQAVLSSDTSDYSHGPWTAPRAGYEVDGEASGSGVWIDAPGLISPSRLAHHESYLMEWRVGIEGHPESGGVYYKVIIDRRAAVYRVRMYEGRPLGRDEWAATLQGMATAAGYVPPGKAGTPEDVNESSPAFDTGWLDYSTEVAKLKPPA